MDYKDINRYMFEDIQICMDKIDAFDRIISSPDLDNFWKNVPKDQPVGHKKIISDALVESLHSLNRVYLNWLAASKFNNAAVEPLPKREAV